MDDFWHVHASSMYVVVYGVQVVVIIVDKKVVYTMDPAVWLAGLWKVKVLIRAGVVVLKVTVEITAVPL